MFGHADCPDTIIPRIEEAIEKQYTANRITAFYVGNRGRFDRLAATAAKRARRRHPDIRLYLLLAYHPGEKAVNLTEGFDNSFYPPLEQTPRKYAIVTANKYMIDTVDSVICYVKHIGNTEKLLAYARRRQNREGIFIENVAEDT